MIPLMLGWNDHQLPQQFNAAGSLSEADAARQLSQDLPMRKGQLEGKKKHRANAEQLESRTPQKFRQGARNSRARV